jgi:HAE1 family hydrophobic/amphiphilic exporter-1
MKKVSLAAGRAALVLAFAAAWMLLPTTGPAAAQEPAASLRLEAKIPRELPEPALTPAAGRLQLTLDQAIEIALERNLDLVVERFDREDAELSVFGNLAIYDLRLSGTATLSDEENATFSTIEASTREAQSLNLGLDRTIFTGGVASLDFTNSRTESTLNLVNPSFRSDFTLSFLQPLLRNRGREVTERNLRVARLGSRISREELERQTAQTLLDVETAYWALIDAREQLLVAREALDLARQLHERNKVEVDVGTRAPLELVQSEATIALREEEIIAAETTLGNAEDELRRLLHLPPALWDLPIEPTTEAETTTLTIELQQALETAVRERPELEAQRLALEQARVEHHFQHNQKKPQLNFNFVYALSGAAGRGSLRNPDDPDNPLLLDDGLTDAIEQVQGLDFPSYTAQLIFAYPLQNRAARANAASAEVAVDRAQTQLTSLEQNVLTEVRSAVRGVNSAAQQITSARVSRQLQEKNLEAEQKRYENGMSTSFQVSEIQEDLTQAKSREVSALTNYRIALARYYQAIGRLLDESGVELVDNVEKH